MERRLNGFYDNELHFLFICPWKWVCMHKVFIMMLCRMRKTCSNSREMGSQFTNCSIFCCSNAKTSKSWFWTKHITEVSNGRFIIYMALNLKEDIWIRYISYTIKSSKCLIIFVNPIIAVAENKIWYSTLLFISSIMKQKFYCVL